MKNVKVYKSNFVLLALTCAVASYAFTKKHDDYTPSYTVTLEEEAFGTYRNGSVYIGKKEYLESLEGLDKDNDVLVVDLRDSSDPDMKIINSYVVDNKDEMRDVIALLCLYEEMYPSSWDRTEDAMYIEWKVHNLLHSINYETDRTMDVDLNNADETLYSNLIFKILK